MYKVSLNVATMGCGKTALACIKAHQLEQEGLKPLCIKPSQSPYVYGKFKSRINKLEQPCVNIARDASLDWIKHQETKIAIVDECQFLTPRQVEQIFRLSLKYDIEFICYGLLTDFKSNMFEGTKRFIELGAKINQLEHRDSNNEPTVINAKINAQNEVLVDGQVVDKDKEKYVAMSLRRYWTELGVL